MMPTDPDQTALLDAWNHNLPGQKELGLELLNRYAEPHRRYHDTSHLALVLRRIDDFATDENLFLVRLAAWFHDAVYAIPPGQVSNEEASARLAHRRLGRAGLEQEELNEVARLVRLTATHRPGARDRNGRLLCDADLAVLAGTPEEYARYVAAVRAEYAALPEADFTAGRLAVLDDLAEGDIFSTAKGRAISQQARANLDAERRSLADRLEQLRTGSPT